jgi:endonuclease III
MKSSFEGQRNNSEREEINQKMKKQARKRWHNLEKDEILQKVIKHAINGRNTLERDKICDKAIKYVEKPWRISKREEEKIRKLINNWEKSWNIKNFQKNQHR